MDKQISSIAVVQMVDTDPDTSYLEQEGFEDALKSYNNDEFGFIGIRAEAEIVVDDVVQKISSGGLWGIEDNSDASYIKEVAQEELSALKDILHALGFTAEQIEEAVSEVTV